MYNSNENKIGCAHPEGEKEILVLNNIESWY
jgi:hypothetical protein